jgi:hypothetical protein
MIWNRCLVAGSVVLFGFAMGAPACGEGRAGGGRDAGDGAVGATGAGDTTGAGGGAGDAQAAGADAAKSGSCSIAPYPDGMACTTGGQACVPDSGYDCCICYPTHGCALAIRWGCITSYQDCPLSPPGVGDTCTLTEMAECVYCSTPPIHVACHNGKWAPIGNELYCN